MSPLSIATTDNHPQEVDAVLRRLYGNAALPPSLLQQEGAFNCHVQYSAYIPKDQHMDQR